MRLISDSKLVSVPGQNSFRLSLNHNPRERARLIAVEIREVDSNGGNVCDIAQLAISPKGAQSLSHGGYITAGSWSWQGEIPLEQPLDIVLQVANAAVNAVIGYTLVIALGNELGGGGQSSQVTKVLPYGNLLIKTGSGAATGTILDVRPASGFRWEVVDLWGYHDDGTSRNTFWSWTDDGTNFWNMMDSGAIAAYTQSPYANPVRSLAQSGALNLSLSYGVYLRYNSLTTLSAGKKLYYVAIVREMTQD